jgi:hypothetical protein
VLKITVKENIYNMLYKGDTNEELGEVCPNYEN